MSTESNMPEKQSRKWLPPWCPDAKTPDGTQVDVAISALQKAVRDCDEVVAVYWVRQLYLAGAKMWKRLHVYAAEDVGLADLSVKTHILELEQAAEKCKGGGKTRDLLHIVEAVMILCRAKKSRAVDNAIVWFKTHPTWRPPTDAEVEALAADGTQPEIPDKAYDKHTQAGRNMGRGIKHFLKEGAVLANESEVAGFQPPRMCRHCWGTGMVRP